MGKTDKTDTDKTIPLGHQSGNSITVLGFLQKYLKAFRINLEHPPKFNWKFKNWNFQKKCLYLSNIKSY